MHLFTFIIMPTLFAFDIPVFGHQTLLSYYFFLVFYLSFIKTQSPNKREGAAAERVTKQSYKIVFVQSSSLPPFLLLLLLVELLVCFTQCVCGSY